MRDLKAEETNITATTCVDTYAILTLATQLQVLEGSEHNGHLKAYHANVMPCSACQ
jgi:hypothetical protein